MFPFRDQNPSHRTPYVTWGLIAVNVIIFFLNYEIFSSQRAQVMFFGTWGIVPAELSSGGGYFTLLSSMFLHGGLMHLGGNMLFLWIFGDNLEDTMGHGKFLGFYVLSGLAAGLAQVATAPFSTIPIVGASGAIAGVMGGYLLLFPRARIDVLLIIVIIIRVISIPAWAMLGIWFAIQLFNGSVADADGGGVAHWAHAGGFVAGIILCLPVWLRRGGTASWGQNHGRPPHAAAQYRIARTNIPRVQRRRASRGRPKNGPWG